MDMKIRMWVRNHQFHLNIDNQKVTWQQINKSLIVQYKTFHKFYRLDRAQNH